MKTGPTNQHLQQLIAHLRIESKKSDAPLWKRIADDLERSTRARRAVNLSRIERNCQAHETIIVPGKVLGAGQLTQALTVAAWQFSTNAKTQIERAKGKAISIHELVKQNPGGKNVRIIG